ncbi:IscS subfamily cysteine desulfurase [Cytobacillus purgationiresistens]|uniref:Cysteine desulfurase n=1 Tax=Cytobacillus purgationiresistens TaxID=863449 RepID=A0ABU0AF59_9BACI|nr:IscS subfamily cysteine desulfurase [Cytobacillus purgationiresistens]MDQ0269893.1 cysteine desulfurase [Cytobacillus purgationiresistens]
MKYFDYAASTPLDEEAAQVFVKASTEYYGNSNSLHDFGGQANELLNHCRQEMADLLAVQETGIYFTSGGTESNFLAIRALLTSAFKTGKHIITSIAEHSSVISVFQQLEEEGYETTYLPFNENGVINLEQFNKALKEETVLVAIQHGNSEIGTLQPILEISKICKRNNILLHSDCVHTFGKMDLKPIAKAVDSLAISGHKFYGPKGSGLAYINPQLNWLSFFPGTVHEKGFRPGTVNLPAVASMTVAAQKAYNELQMNHQHDLSVRSAFLRGLAPIMSHCIIYDALNEDQLPSTVGLRMKGIEGQYVMLECNRRGFAISTGSACQSDMHAPSKTMKAMDVKLKEAKEFIRISFGRSTTVNDATELAAALTTIIKQTLNQ